MLKICAKFAYFFYNSDFIVSVKRTSLRKLLMSPFWFSSYVFVKTGLNCCQDTNPLTVKHPQKICRFWFLCSLISLLFFGYFVIIFFVHLFGSDLCWCSLFLGANESCDDALMRLLLSARSLCSPILHFLFRIILCVKMLQTPLFSVSFILPNFRIPVCFLFHGSYRSLIN